MCGIEVYGLIVALRWSIEIKIHRPTFSAVMCDYVLLLFWWLCLLWIESVSLSNNIEGALICISHMQQNFIVQLLVIAFGNF